jgi:hypothetical protein
MQGAVGQREKKHRASADLPKDLGPPRVTATQIFVQTDLDPSSLKISNQGSDRVVILSRVADEDFHRAAHLPKNQRFKSLDFCSSIRRPAEQNRKSCENCKLQICQQTDRASLPLR